MEKKGRGRILFYTFVPILKNRGEKNGWMLALRIRKRIRVRIGIRFSRQENEKKITKQRNAKQSGTARLDSVYHFLFLFFFPSSPFPSYSGIINRCNCNTPFRAKIQTQMYINIFIFDLQRGPINRLHEAQDAGNRVRRAQFYHFTGVAVNIKRRGGGGRGGGERRGRNDIKLIRDPRGRGGRGGVREIVGRYPTTPGELCASAYNNIGANAMQTDGPPSLLRASPFPIRPCKHSTLFSLSPPKNAS